MRCKALLHGLQVLKIVSVLTQAPSHDTAKLLLRDNFLELAVNHFRGVPSPEEVVFTVEIVLAAALGIGLAVLLGLAPRVDDGEPLAGTVVG